jgi:hypothetical protein
MRSTCYGGLRFESVTAVPLWSRMRGRGHAPSPVFRVECDPRGSQCKRLKHKEISAKLSCKAVF